jgi:hypothetical protein
MTGSRCLKKRRRRGAERGNRVEEPPAMTDQDDAKILQVVGS